MKKLLSHLINYNIYHRLGNFIWMVQSGDTAPEDFFKPFEPVLPGILDSRYFLEIPFYNLFVTNVAETEHTSQNLQN